MATPPVTSPWELCDTATRASIAALKLLNRKRIDCAMSIEDVAIESGLSIMTATRALQGHGCNLAEFCALCLALNECPGDTLNAAMRPAPPPVQPR